MKIRSNFKLLAALLFAVLASCVSYEREENATVEIDLYNIVQRDTLRIGFVTGAASYFNYGNETVGFDYELAQQLADSLNLTLQALEATDDTELFSMLTSGSIDIAAGNFQLTKELGKKFALAPALADDKLVLVQPLSIHTLTNTIDLANDTITVIRNSMMASRAAQLNKETGYKFTIHYAPDSLSEQDLITQVAKGKIKFTIAREQIAKLHKTHYKNIDVRLAVGFPLRSGWLVRRASVHLQEAINAWRNSADFEITYANLRFKYFRNSFYFLQKKIHIPRGAISPYDAYFKKYALEIDWDWRLVAAIAFHESRFDPTQVSRAGAAGLMQLMPRTAANFGLNRHNIFNPELNIEAAIQYIKMLNLTFRRIENKSERIKFILASYNSGPAHVFDARALAPILEKNPDIWFGNVEYALSKKSNPAFYNHPVVKHGRFRAKETTNFVIKVLNTYEQYKQKKT